MNDLHESFRFALMWLCLGAVALAPFMSALWGLWRLAGQCFRHGLFRGIICGLCVVVAVFVGAVKPQLRSGLGDSQLLLTPLTMTADGELSTSEVPVCSATLLATDLLPGESVGPLVCPEAQDAEEELRFFGIVPYGSSTLLGLAWPYGTRFTDATLDLYGGDICAPSNFTPIASIDVSQATSNIAVEIPAFPTNGFYQARSRLDSDGDHISDVLERTRYHTDPNRADSDGDGDPDGWEILHGLDPLAAAPAIHPSVTSVVTVATVGGFGLSFTSEGASLLSVSSLSAASVPNEHVVASLSAVSDPTQPSFDRTFNASCRPLVDATVPFFLSADDDATLTVGGGSLSVAWIGDYGAERSAEFSLGNGERTPISLSYHNDGGASFLNCYARSGPSAPGLTVEPRVREFLPAPAFDLRTLAPSVRITGVLDPLCDYWVTAELEDGLASSGTGSITPASSTPLDVTLPVWPDGTSSHWTASTAPRATVRYILYEDGRPCATNFCTFVRLAPKERDECGCCEEGTQCANGCVDFSQRFGSTPSVPGLPAGRIRVRADRPGPALWTPAALAYDHPMMRRILVRHNLDAVILDGLGRPAEYRRGLPAGASSGDSGQLFVRADGTLVEELPDGLRVHYAADGSVAALEPEYGSPVPVSDLGITVVRAADGTIASVETVSDGRVSAAATGDRAWRLTWTSSSSAVVKTFDFTGNGTDEFTLVETRNADFTFAYHWTYSEAAGDWVLEKGSGTSSARREARTLSYDAEARTWTSVLDATGADGTSVTSDFVVLSRDGHAVRATERKDALSGRVLESSVLDSEGRVSSRTDELGGTTTYAYDSCGRIVRETFTAPGLPVRTVETAYSAGVAPIDFRPLRRRVLEDGILLSSESFAYSDHEVIRTLTADGTARRSRTVYDDLGRVVLSVRENGRATRTVRSEPDAGGSWCETVDEGLWTEGNGFALVNGRSEREIVTRSAQGDAVRCERFAFVSNAWHSLSWETHVYNAAHKAVSSVYSDGTSETSDWICTGPVFKTSRDGVTVTNVYNAAKELASSIRRGPFGDVTTTYVRDAAGRVVGEVTSAAGCETRTVSRSYDSQGRVVSETDAEGRTALTAYSADDRTETVTYADGGTRVTVRNADGSLASVTGTAVLPEFYAYGVTNLILSGRRVPCRWKETRFGRPDSPRFTRTFSNGFGETVREERSGFGGAVLVTENAYDAAGNLLSSAMTGEPVRTYAYDAWGELVSTSEAADGTVRTVTVSSENALDGENVWAREVRMVSTSDPAIAPLVTESLTRLSGLSSELDSETIFVDVRGNTNRVWSAYDAAAAKRTTWSSRAGIATASTREVVDGADVRTISFSSVTNVVSRDAYGRETSRTDGRGNTTTSAYDARGRLASITDATNAVTRYVYDVMGRTVAVTNALGEAVLTEYDPRGNTVFEGGATYPVRSAYDVYGNRISMTTYRSTYYNMWTEGDVTSWMYDEASGLVTAKTYADGRGPTYSYDANGRLASRTWARGIVTSYVYNGFGELTRIDYSDGTPSVVIAYDALGRKATVTDAKGTTTFTYDAFGDKTRQAVSGLYEKTLVRHRDAFGRDTGHTLDGTRRSEIDYAATSGRLARARLGDVWHAWTYLEGSDLKSSLEIGTVGRVDWAYEPNRDLLALVRNEAHGGIVSQYAYGYDAAGRRISRSATGSAMSATRMEIYGYNTRGELTSVSTNGVSVYSYVYDDIGNRITSVEPDRSCAYTANALNQYVQISTVNLNLQTQPFLPAYDLDGNQMLIETKTGVWSVTYNGENRPILWTSGPTNLVMKYDFMGRRVEYIETVGDLESGPVVTNVHQKFVYDNYLCIQRLNGATNEATDDFDWDPTEPVATRPLHWRRYHSGTSQDFFYTHDGNKNVSEVISYQMAVSVVAHCEYTPFGSTLVIDGVCAPHNPWIFSSEYGDDSCGIVYYNFRHYCPKSARWMSIDILGEEESLNLYSFLRNECLEYSDALGLKRNPGNRFKPPLTPPSPPPPPTIQRPGPSDNTILQEMASSLARVGFRSKDSVVSKGIRYCEMLSPQRWPVLPGSGGPYMIAGKCRCCYLGYMEKDWFGERFYFFQSGFVSNVSCEKLKAMGGMHSLASGYKYKEAYIPWY